jgi:hypothetical protein
MEAEICAERGNEIGKEDWKRLAFCIILRLLSEI